MLKRPILNGAKITWVSPLTGTLGFMIAALILYLRGQPALLVQMPVIVVVILLGDFAVAVVQRLLSRARQYKEEQ